MTHDCEVYAESGKCQHGIVLTVPVIRLRPDWPPVIDGRGVDIYELARQSFSAGGR